MYRDGGKLLLHFPHFRHPWRSYAQKIATAFSVYPPSLAVVCRERRMRRSGVAKAMYAVCVGNTQAALAFSG